MATNSQGTFIDLNANRGPQIIRVAVALLIVSTLAVICRLIARRLKKVKLIASDYTLLLALLGVWLADVNAIVEAHYGSGRHIEVVSMKSLTSLLKSVYVAEISYSITIPAVKISILLLYRSIFPGRRFAIIANIVGAGVLAWGIAVLLTAIFSCKPIHGFWDLTTPSSCISVRTFYIGNSISNLITDIIILSLPVPPVWKMKLSKIRKVGVLGMFLTGGLVCVATIVRIICIFEMDLADFTYGFYDTTIWTTIEISVAIVSACLPTLRPLFQYFSPKTPQTFSVVGRKFRATPREPDPQKISDWEMSMNEFQSLPDNPLGQVYPAEPAQVKTAITTGYVDLEKQ